MSNRVKKSFFLDFREKINMVYGMYGRMRGKVRNFILICFRFFC